MSRNDRIIKNSYALVQCFYWAQSAATVSFASYYLQELGFAKTSMGVILAVSNLFGFLLPNIFGSCIDKGSIGAIKTSCIVLGGEMLSVIPLLFVRKAGFLTSLCLVVLISLLFAINPIYTKICMDLQRAVEKVQYSIPRALGSVSFAFTAWLIGMLLPETGLNLLPCAALLFIVLQMVSMFRIRGFDQRIIKKSTESSVKGSNMTAFLKQNRRYTILALGIMVLFAATNTINNYLYQIVENVGGTEKTLGLLSAMIGLTEVLVMIIYARIRPEKKKTAKFLAFSLVFFAVKIFAIMVANSIQTLFAAFLLQGLSFALYVPVIVDYVDKAIPYEDSAKGQSLCGSMISLGTFIATLFSGRWLDLLPVQTVLLRLLIISLVGLPICFAGINWKVDQQVRESK